MKYEAAELKIVGTVQHIVLGSTSSLDPDTDIMDKPLGFLAGLDE